MTGREGARLGGKLGGLPEEENSRPRQEPEDSQAGMGTKRPREPGGGWLGGGQRRGWGQVTLGSLGHIQDFKSLSCGV